MIDVSILIYTILYITFSIILVWKTNLLMLETKKIWILFPFFIFGITICFRAVFIFYSLFEKTIWVSIEFVALVCLIWIFIILWRRINE